MSRLDKDREKIDEIDVQIAKLFEERFETVRDIIDYKIENRLPILNSDRENEITKKNVDRIQDDDIKPYFEAWYHDLLALSKEFQRQIQDEM